MNIQEGRGITLKKSEQSSYKMIITKELERKIRFICSKVSQVEWSGVLYYTHTGNFEDGSLTIIAKDLLVLDIGNGSSTNFNYDNPDICTYMIDNDLLDCDSGLIHSHCTFDTFFSGTDQNTLLQEGTDRNIFVSLIVNNAGTYTAGITRRMFSKIMEEACYKTFEDKEVCTPVEKYETQYVEWFQLTIEKEWEENNAFPDIAQRLLSIAEKKKEEEERRKNLYYNRAPEAPNQLSLFEEKEPPYFPVKNTNEISSAVLPSYDDIIVKLLTGNIAATTQTISIDKAAANMQKLFDNTFESGEFSYFAEGFIDFIVNNWGESVLPELSEDEWKNSTNEETYGDSISRFAYILGEDLIKIVSNKYTEVYSNTLNNYL